MTSRADWQQVEATYDSVPEGTNTRLCLGSVLELYDQVMYLAERYESLRDREAFNVRLAALQAAREHVSGLPSEQTNARGYRDHALRPAERVAQELSVARYLLGEDR